MLFLRKTDFVFCKPVINNKNNQSVETIRNTQTIFVANDGVNLLRKYIAGDLAKVTEKTADVKLEENGSIYHDPSRNNINYKILA